MLPVQVIPLRSLNVAGGIPEMVQSESDKEKLYADFHGKVMSYVAGKVSNPHDAEDLVSSVFVKVYQKMDVYDESKASVSTWIYTITRNTVVDYYRTRKQFSEVPEDFTIGGEIDQKLINDEMLEQLYEALSQLDVRSRDLIILHYYKGYTLKVTAEKLQISYAYAKIIHRKALQSLQRLMKDSKIMQND